MIDVSKIIISKDVVYGTKNSLKYFIGYNDEDNVIRQLLLKLPQMIGYPKEFDNSITKLMIVNYLKNTVKYGGQLLVYSELNLIVNQFMVILILT